MDAARRPDRPAGVPLEEAAKWTLVLVRDSPSMVRRRKPPREGLYGRPPPTSRQTKEPG